MEMGKGALWTENNICGYKYGHKSLDTFPIISEGILFSLEPVDCLRQWNVEDRQIPGNVIKSMKFCSLHECTL